MPDEIDIEDYETCAVHEVAYLRASGCFDCKTSDISTVPMAGGTPAASEAKDSPTLAAEMLRRLADSRWADGHRDTDPLHAAAEMLSKEPKPSPGERAAAEVKAELELLADDRKIISQARKDAGRLAPGRGPSRSHEGWLGPHDDPESLALQLLGFVGDSPDGLWAHVKYCASHGNTMARELLRQDKAAKRAKIGELAPHVVWEESETDVFVAQIGVYEAKVFDPDPGECWRWSLELVGDLDPKVDSASGIFGGDVDGAKARAEEIAAVLSQHMERS